MVRTTLRSVSVLSACLACVWLVSTGADAQTASQDASGWRWADDTRENIYAVSVFAGEGTERNISDTLQNLFDYQGSSDRIAVVALERRLAWFSNSLTLDAEVFYGRHYGRERYHEFGMTGWVRWHRFPWGRWLRTSFGVGIGHS